MTTEQPLLDLDKLRERFDNDEELLAEIFAVFASEAPGRRSGMEAALAGAKDHRAVGDGLGKGDLQLDAVHPVGRHLPDHLAVDRKRWVAEHQVGHEQDALAFQPFFQFAFQVHARRLSRNGPCRRAGQCAL